jgi:hypothetical protein
MAAQADPAQDIHFEKAKPIFIRDLFERLRLEDTEIVDQNIDFRKLPKGLLNGSGGAQVGGEALDLRSARVRAQFLYCSGDALLRPAIDDDRGSLLYQSFSNGVADARSGTGDEGALALELEIHI